MAFNFLGMKFGKEDPQPITQQTESSFSSFAFSTPFGVIGNGNLSLPYVNKYYTVNNYVRFGNDNLYPQLLNQLYYTSAIHGDCIDFTVNAIIGGGYTIDMNNISGPEKVDILTSEKIYKLKKLTKWLTRDYILHRRVCVLITKKNGKVNKLTRLDPSTIRNNTTNTKFVWSTDWSKGVGMKDYDKYTPNCKDGDYIYVYQDNTPGQDIYPIPTYNSILNWAYLDGEQAFFHKSNIQNSVFPSAVIRRPKEFGSIDEVAKFKEEISSKTGASNGGRLLVLTGNGMDDVPEFTPVSTNQNDKLFEGTAKELKDNICFAHKINPSIIGIKVSGSLGNAQELEMSYKIFEKNVVLPERNTMTEIFNELLNIIGIKQLLIINSYQIVGEQIVEIDEKVSKLIKTLNAMPESLRNKVLENLSPNEVRSLAGLDPIMNADVPNGVTITQPTEMDSEVNDALKGLSAKENMDLMRIIRDHGKGKLNDALAIARLKGYGLTDLEAKDILGIEE